MGSLGNNETNVNYRIFDVVVSCNFPLYGLTNNADEEADITVEKYNAAAVNEQGFEWIHEWEAPDGEVTLACARNGDKYLLRFPYRADFQIDLRYQLVRIFPHPLVSEKTVAQLLLDQVIPRLLFHRGRMVIHASAVMLKSGHVIAFLGNTGRGKSTLATSFHQAGDRLITDDCLLIERSDSSLIGMPAYPGLRLWPDSFTALFSRSDQSEATTLETGKIKLTIDPGGNENAKRQLAALFILGDPTGFGMNEPTRIELVHGRAVMMAMVEAAFVLDLVSHDSLRRNFSLIGDVTQSKVPVYTLDYPRQYALLPMVRAMVEKTVQADSAC